MGEMAAWEHEDDDQLLAAAPGCADAFAAFYRRYERVILAYFLRRTADVEVAADLTAEVFAAALVSCSRYRPGPAPAHAWLFGIAQHRLASSARRGKVEARARRRLRMAPIAPSRRRKAVTEPNSSGWMSPAVGRRQRSSFERSSITRYWRTARYGLRRRCRGRHPRSPPCGSLTRGHSPYAHSSPSRARSSGGTSGRWQPQVAGFGSAV